MGLRDRLFGGKDDVPEGDEIDAAEQARLEELREHLEGMYARGALTDIEYRAQKRKLFGEKFSEQDR